MTLADNLRSSNFTLMRRPAEGDVWRNPSGTCTVTIHSDGGCTVRAFERKPEPFQPENIVPRWRVGFSPGVPQVLIATTVVEATKEPT